MTKDSNGVQSSFPVSSAAAAEPEVLDRARPASHSVGMELSGGPRSETDALSRFRGTSTYTVASESAVGEVVVD